MSLMLRRLWIQLTADRKRFGVLCAMLAVGLLLWARVIVVSNIPRTAVAEDGAKPAQVVDRQARMNTAVLDRLARSRVEVRLDYSPRRDPFSVNAEYFPKPKLDETREQKSVVAVPDMNEDEEQRQARQRREQLQLAADGLKLEAVMRGAGIVVINGQTYRIGDEVSAAGNQKALFELTDVRQRSAVLHADGLEFVIELDAP